MIAYYTPGSKTPREVAAWVGVSDWQAERNIVPAMRLYSGRKVMDIIGQIRRTDARSKGVDNPAIESGDLMKELLFFILHWCLYPFLDAFEDGRDFVSSLPSFF